MAAPLFSLDLAPSFWFAVQLTVPGEPAPVEIECEGKHFPRDAFAEFTAGAVNRTDEETCAEFLLGWRGVDLAYSRAALHRLLQKCPRAGLDIYEAWCGQYLEARRKNS
jgi:hypothetical protein